MIGRFVIRGLTLLVGAWLVGGCSKPDLPTKPPLHLALTATVEIDKKAYPVEFTWTEENGVAWNEGVGWHTEWNSSDLTCVRILDDKYAVVVWLPGVADVDLTKFQPTFALLDRNDPEFLRSYPTLKVGEERDGVFRVTQLKIERAQAAFPPKGMTVDEEALKGAVADRGYGYLYGMRFTQEQWGQSQELRNLLAGSMGITPLGKRGIGRKDASPLWRAFATFNAGTAMKMNMDRHLFGFEMRDDMWRPLAYPGVYWYRKGLGSESRPVWMLYQNQRIDQQQNELIFDQPAQELIVVWRYPLEPLSYNR